MSVVTGIDPSRTQSLMRWKTIHNPLEFRRVIGNMLRKELMESSRRLWDEFPRALVEVRISPIELQFFMQTLEFTGLSAHEQPPASCDHHHIQNYHLTADGLLYQPQEGWSVVPRACSIRGKLTLIPIYRQLLNKYAN